MSAERMPQAEGSNHTSRNYKPSWVNLVLQPVLNWCLRNPALTVIITLLLVTVSLAGTYYGLTFKTSRLDLINPNSEFNKRWLEYIDAFGSQDDVVVIVEGTQVQQIESAVDELAAEIAAQPDLFAHVFYKVDTSKLRSKGLYYATDRQLSELHAFVSEAASLGQGPYQDVLNRLWDCWRVQLAPPNTVPVQVQSRSLEGFDRLSQSLEAALGTQYTYKSPLHGLDEGLDLTKSLDCPPQNYLWAKKDAMALILLKFTTSDQGAFAQNSEQVVKLREIISHQQSRLPGVKLGLTGLPIMEFDEMSSSQTAMNSATWLSLLAVAVLFLFTFKGLRYSVLLIATLLVGIGLTMGYITASIGHLNILSIAFSAILVGLGVDFGLHYIARYLQCRKQGDCIQTALVRASQEVGPGIVVGAITTAVAFAAAGGQEFIGVAELGQIAAAGIIICCAVAMIFLPVVLLITDTRKSQKSSTNIFRMKMETFTNACAKNHAAVMILTVGFTAMALTFVTDLRYDFNLMNLQPKGLESVEWEKRLLTESDQNVWFALSVSKDRNELLARKKQFEQLPNIIKVEEIASLFPENSQARTREIAYINQVTGYLQKHYSSTQSGIQIPASPTAGDLSAFLTAIENCPNLLKKHPTISERIVRIRRVLQQLSPDEVSARLDRFEQQMTLQYQQLMSMIYSVSNPTVPELSDLPDGLTSRMRAPDGTWAMRIYSRNDIWEMDNMRQFVESVRSVDPNATGNPLQTYECSLQMKSSYEHAAWYALAGILFLLYVDLRNLRDTALAMVPLTLGMLIMGGVMGFFNIPLNSANMIVLPLILGIGIDDGVHIIHDYHRRDKNHGFSLSNSTASALTLTSLTSILGFCSLILAEHRGLQSLGLVLSLGVGCCMITSLSVLPAILGWLAKREMAAHQAAHNNSAHNNSAHNNSAHNNSVLNSSAMEPVDDQTPIINDTIPFFESVPPKPQVLRYKPSDAA